jgi:outer membrane protein OmpA-like peptidoglycan-associated protein
LAAPPIDDVGPGYTLDHVLFNYNLRARMRRVDLNSINFDFGAWDIEESQYGKLESLARAIKRILDRDPDEVFLIEGHTDAVGDPVSNRSLSDRRAEEVATILTEEFGVPPENLVIQGYGEEFLKVDTQEASRANRRVTVRRITPLLDHHEARTRD